MRPCGAVLNWFGSKAPALLLGSLVVGALLPSAAAMSEAALPIAAFLMMFGSLVAAGLAPYERPNGLLRLGLLILVVAIGPCLAAALAVKGFSLADDLALGVVLSVAGPPMASAAALAVILGLPPRLTLALSVVPTLLCPLTTPVLVRVFTGESVDAIALAVKLVAVVGSGSLAAVAVLAVLQRSGGNRANLSMAASGVSMIGLIGVGIAAASRARVEVEADLAGFGVLMVGALLLCVFLGAVAALVFAAFGSAVAGTLSLVWGLRNQSIVWAALGPTLPLEAERFLVAMVLPIAILPTLVRAYQAATRRRAVALQSVRSQPSHNQ